MLIAYNNDIEFRSRWYHIQTEDNGIKDGHVTTTVFYSGQILDSKSTSYRDSLEGVVDQDSQNRIIKDLMVKQHQEFYTRLFDGRYEAAVSGVGSPRPLTPSVVPSVAGASSLGNNRVASQSALPSSLRQADSVNSDPMRNGLGSKLSKPDILRASQQIPAVGMSSKLLSGIGNSGGSVKPSNYPLSKTSDLSSMDSVVPAVSRTTGLTSPIERSDAVMASERQQRQKAYCGLRWTNDDLAIDMLVAKLLDAS
jgi:hypothetical protein